LIRRACFPTRYGGFSCFSSDLPLSAEISTVASAFFPNERPFFSTLSFLPTWFFNFTANVYRSASSSFSRHDTRFTPYSPGARCRYPRPPVNFHRARPIAEALSSTYLSPPPPLCFFLASLLRSLTKPDPSLFVNFSGRPPPHVRACLFFFALFLFECSVSLSHKIFFPPVLTPLSCLFVSTRSLFSWRKPGPLSLRRCSSFLSSAMHSPTAAVR